MPSNLQLYASADANHLLHANCKGQTIFSLFTCEQPLFFVAHKKGLLLLLLLATTRS